MLLRACEVSLLLCAVSQGWYPKPFSADMNFSWLQGEERREGKNLDLCSQEVPHFTVYEEAEAHQSVLRGPWATADRALGPCECGWHQVLVRGQGVPLEALAGRKPTLYSHCNLWEEVGFHLECSLGGGGRPPSSY